MSPRPRVFIRSKDLKRIVGRHLSKPLERRSVGLEKGFINCFGHQVRWWL